MNAVAAIAVGVGLAVLAGVALAWTIELGGSIRGRVGRARTDRTLRSDPGVDSVDALRERFLDARVRLADVDRGTWLVLALACLLFVAFSIYTSALYARYALYGSDFGSYVHMFATTLAGQGFLRQGKYIANHPHGSYWGGHFTLTLLAFLPLYALVPSPLTLLVAKSFVLAASVPMLWWLARRQLENDRLAGLVVVSYAFNPFLWSAWSFDFQEQCLLPVLVFAAYYFYVEERRVAFLATLTLVLVTNETEIMIVGGFLVGLTLAAVRRGRLRREWSVLLSGFVLTLAAKSLSEYVMSSNSRFSGISPTLVAGPLQPYVSGGRVSTSHLVSVLLQHPNLFAASFSISLTAKLLFAVALFAPVLFLPLADESTLGALAPFLAFAWVFSQAAPYYSFSHHYPLYLLPFIYVGTLRTLDRLHFSFPSSVNSSPSLTMATSPSPAKPPSSVIRGSWFPSPLRDSWRPSPRTDLLARAVVLVLLLNVAAFAATGGGSMQRIPPRSSNMATVEAAIDEIPAGATLLTQNDIYPHVAQRSTATYIPNGRTFDEYLTLYPAPTPKYVIYDTRLDVHQIEWWQIVQNVYGDRIGGEYGVYGYDDGVWILKRGYDGPIHPITGDRIVEWFGPAELNLGEGQLRHGVIVGRNGTADKSVWYGPYATLPAGRYTVTFRLRTSGPNEPVLNLQVATGSDHDVIAERSVPSTDGWTDVRLSFSLSRPTSNVEFRGFYASDRSNVDLRNVTLVRRGEVYGGNSSANGTGSGRGRDRSTAGGNPTTTATPTSTPSTSTPSTTSPTSTVPATSTPTASPTTTPATSTTTPATSTTTPATPTAPSTSTTTTSPATATSETPTSTPTPTPTSAISTPAAATPTPTSAISTPAAATPTPTSPTTTPAPATGPAATTATTSPPLSQRLLP